MSRRRRWVCPLCTSGPLGPSRMAADDVRRYCLKCSAETGRLVRRQAPALEKQRARKVQRANAAKRNRRQRELREVDERHTVRGVNLRVELRRLSGLPTVRAQCAGDRPLVAMTVSWTQKTYVTGRAWKEQTRLHLSLYRGVSLSEVYALLAHELAHVIAPPNTGHGERWRRLFARILADGYGLKDFPASAMQGTKHQLHERARAALRDRLIDRASEPA